MHIGQMANETGAEIHVASDSTRYPNLKGHPDFTTEIIFTTLNKIKDHLFEAKYTEAKYPIIKISD